TGQEPVFSGEPEIAETVHRTVSMLHVWRMEDVYFSICQRDEVDAPAVAIVPGSDVGGRDGPEEVRANDLDELRVVRDHRRRPLGLLCERGRGPCLPAGDEVVLCLNGRRREKDEKQAAGNKSAALQRADRQ